ncbi:MAG: DUF2505 domain-containing protein [Candidatus Nanopelagicales bacterium]
MATRVDEVQHYTVGPDEVFAMLSDPAFIEKKCLASGSIEASAEVTTEDAGTTIVSRRVLPAKLPGFAKKFVGETLTLIETQKWSDPDAGARTATFVVDFGNNPISFGGDATLRPDGDGTRVEYIGDIRCSVPFVGGKIENVALDWITRYLDKEQRVGTSWLDGDGS